MTSAKRWALIATVLGSSMVFLDSTVVNVALPRIGQELPTPRFGVLEAQSFVYNGYLLSLSALLILAGALNDYYGRKRMFTVGLVGFGLVSALCGAAPTMELLIVFRILQGAMGALLVPGSLSILTATFSGEEQGRAFGIWAGASAWTTILGPALGGFLVDAISWRAAFFINVPLALFAWWATARHVEESRDEEASGRFDWLGAFVVALAVGGLSLGAIRGQERQWQDPLAWAALVIGGVAAASLPYLMTRRRNPLVPPRLFRSRNFTVTNISTLAIYGSLYVIFYFLPIYLQGTIDYTATAAGLAGIPGVVFLAAFSARFGSLAGRYGPRWFMAVGPMISAIGTFWYLRMPANSAPWQARFSDARSLLPPVDYWIDVFPGVLVFGIGAMVFVAPLTTALMTSVPVRNSGLASAINNAISRVGPQLAGALIFIAVTATFYAGLSARVPDMDFSDPQTRSAVSPLNEPAPSVPGSVVAVARQESTEAFRLAMGASAALLVIGGVVNAVGIRNEAAVQPAEQVAMPPA